MTTAGRLEGRAQGIDTFVEVESMNNEAFIVAGVRTPIGSMGGVLSTVPATELGATCIKAAVGKGEDSRR